MADRVQRLITILLAVLGVGSVARLGLIDIQTAQAQTPVAPTVQTPGPWQPLALVNPKQPIQVDVINETSYTLEYGLTTTEGAPRELEPGRVATFRRLPLPAFLLINSTSSQVNLTFKLAVTGNLITVSVQTVPNSVPGDSTLNINDRGGIYIY